MSSILSNDPVYVHSKSPSASWWSRAGRVLLWFIWLAVPRLALADAALMAPTAQDPEAQYRLGVRYDLGTEGLTHDSKQAVMWYSAAAKQGYMLAQFRLAEAYLHGIGIEKNIDKAVQWYSAAAKQGHEYSEIRLQQLSEHTEGAVDRVVDVYGTGFFVTARHVVTNWHVVRTCRRITLSNAYLDGEEASVFASDPGQDLAVLLTKQASSEHQLILHGVLGNKLVPALVVQQAVQLVGYAGGVLQIKPTVILHPLQPLRLAEPGRPAHSFLQRTIILRDSARPGDSGGPVLTREGTVIGVTRAHRLGSEVKDYRVIGGAAIAVHGLTLDAFLTNAHVPFHAGTQGPAEWMYHLDGSTVHIRCTH